MARRHVVMVEALALVGGERVLEIGCGGGVAATLVAERLATGRYLGIDRSATQIAAARKRNGHLPNLRFEVAALADLDVGAERFDRVFAMHVRAILEPSGDAELGAVRRALAPGGSIHVGWEPLAGTDPATIGEAQAKVLADHGFEVADLLLRDGTVVVAARVR